MLLACLLFKRPAQHSQQLLSVPCACWWFVLAPLCSHSFRFLLSRALIGDVAATGVVSETLRLRAFRSSSSLCFLFVFVFTNATQRSIPFHYSASNMDDGENRNEQESASKDECEWDQDNNGCEGLRAACAYAYAWLVAQS